MAGVLWGLGVTDEVDNGSPEPPKGSGKKGKASRAVLNAAGGLVPFAGGLLSAAAGVWSENEQESVNKFLQHWIAMLQDELREKERTILEVMARVDIHNVEIEKRIHSDEYQSLVRKTFREWAASESERKRIFVRNILANAATSCLTSDHVVRMFLEWLKLYSDLHFEVIGAIYNRKGITRFGIWQQMGREQVREDSADADLFKLVIRDLSTGGVIRQARETDPLGNYIKKTTKPRGAQTSTMKSAFDDEDGYELTALGDQFVHYAMNELSLRIEFSEN
mgnify:CR=1 FL=1